MEKQSKLLNFLLIEDNDDHAMLIQKSLQKNRVSNSIERAATGEDGLEILRASKQRPFSEQVDIVLLDINLPKMSGIEVLETIKEDSDLKSTPVVMLTTSAAEKDRIAAYKNQANSYLVKPVEFDQFLKMIADLGLYWGVWNWGPDKH